MGSRSIAFSGLWFEGFTLTSTVAHQHVDHILVCVCGGGGVVHFKMDSDEV